MSKITRALEKAARERLQRAQEAPTADTAGVTVALAAPELGGAVGGAAPLGEISIDPHIVSAADDQSPIAEQYRILKTNLQSLSLRHGPKVLVVTSAVHAEGKTVTAINLTLTLARQQDLKVLLVDGDLRRGSVHRWLGLSEGPKGLSTVLSQGGVLDGSLLRLKSPALSVLPAGPVPLHPAELLESSAMKRLLATLRMQFDLILIDTPPVLPVVDPGVLGALADGVLLVVRAGKTQRRTVAQAQRVLEQMKASVLGCVLTHAAYHLPGYYHYYRSGHRTHHSASGTQTAPPATPPVTTPAASAWTGPQ